MLFWRNMIHFSNSSPPLASIFYVSISLLRSMKWFSVFVFINGSAAPQNNNVKFNPPLAKPFHVSSSPVVSNVVILIHCYRTVIRSKPSRREQSAVSAPQGAHCVHALSARVCLSLGLRGAWQMTLRTTQHCARQNSFLNRVVHSSV